MSEMFVVQYQTRPEAADENERIVREVFAELNATNPGGLRYVSLRLGDGVTFVHIGIVEGEVNPLGDTKAFQEFQQTIGERLAGSPQRSDATVVGAYGLPGLAENPR